ncbi:MAG: PDZ domain-containing protein [Acidobacteria bacterium]|nr:MAG: PDZ domain-containing protein [Acidobacteriota bacterium]
MHRGDVPDFPRKLIDRDPALARLARKAAPEADLVAAWIDGRDMVRPTVWLALVVPDPGIIEATGWRPDDPAAETATLGVFAVSLPAQRTYLGFDLVERRFGPPVVAAVQPGGPAEAAGVAPGMVLTAIDGRPVGSAEDLARLRAVLAPGQRVALSFGLGREPKVVELKAERTLAAPNPARLHGLLAPALARARSQRLAGDPWQRVAGGLWAGMILARLGESEAAARVLDRTTIEPALDPPGDARGTVLFVLERLFRSLANQEYAEELRARRSLLEGARYGGRDGPPLRYADAESPPSR